MSLTGNELKNFILSQFSLGSLRPADYTSNGQALQTADVSYQSEGSEVSINTLSTMPAGRTSMLGKAVFCDMQLQLPDGGFIYLDVVLSDVSRTKNIVKTSVNGSSSTVKEYISSGDFSIKVRGVLYSNVVGDYPKAQVASLESIFARNEAIPVTSEYLRQYGIFFIVIEDYSWPQRNGFQHMQLFEFTAVSDTENDVLIERI